MVGESFRTIFKYPKMLAGFALPILAITALFIPMIIAMEDIDAMGDDPTIIIAALMATVFIYFFLILAMYFVYMPILFNYIYEASMDNVEKGWAKRGLKRNWWKIFVTMIMAAIPFYFLYFIIMIPTFMLAATDQSETILIVMAVMSVVLAIASLFWGAFMTAALVSVVAEEDFGKGLKGAFKFGFKNYMKIVLAMVVLFIGLVLISISFNMMPTGFFSTQLSWDIVSDRYVIISLAVVVALICAAVYSFISSFMFVYANKLYINRRQELAEKQERLLQMQQSENI